MVATSLVLALGSGLAALALPTQQPLIGINFADEFKTSCNVNNPAAEKTYYGVGNNKDTNAGQVKLRISNGGAGLSGLVGALADEFITYMVNKTDIDKRVDPFRVEWVKGDTTETLNYLATGQADIGITYNKAAECQAMSDKVAARRVYGFRDHFYLVGPHNNPAGLNVYQNGTANQTVFTQFQKIVSTGNNATHQSPPTRFLSRFDKSATNIKDSELFVAIGQVPWGLAYSKWYHQYIMYPIDALKAAALLEEYTITDRGTWLSTPKNITEMLVLYNEGKDDETQDNPDVVEGPADPLLNPAFFLTSTKICEENKDLADAFLDWVVDRALGQEVIKGYRRNDSDEWLYTGAPNRTDLRIQNCTIQGS
ncbi:PBP superfamily domain, partial [Rhizoctonia solani]